MVVKALVVVVIEVVVLNPVLNDQFKSMLVTNIRPTETTATSSSFGPIKFESFGVSSNSFTIISDRVKSNVTCQLLINCFNLSISSFKSLYSD
ncbi:unnamed protein product [Schistosoma margrebowiei]|uniref:Uncharacterized protein n=1 Tax=Schistosoma margrebowiei TaxID=48269 RepID=A0A3P7VP51_9TREM|nr:unnamed protein product [Schistosoma margrebowiei]